MKSIKLTFTRAATGKTGCSLFWLALWALAIDDDRQRRQREKDRRNKRNRDAMPGC